jgi:hypothetical protein
MGDGNRISRYITSAAVGQFPTPLHG